MLKIEKFFLLFLLFISFFLIVIAIKSNSSSNSTSKSTISQKPMATEYIKNINSKNEIYHNVRIYDFDKNFSLETIDPDNENDLIQSLFFKLKLMNIPAEEILNILPRVEKIIKIKKDFTKDINTLYPWEIPLTNLKNIKFTAPLKNFYFRTDESIYPGATRYYRHGIHRGLDFSDLKGGKIAQTGAPIYSIYSGEVVKIKNDHKEFEQKDIFYKLRLLSRKYFYTHEDYLDFFRGNQIYIRNGSMFFIYAHLEKIKNGLKVGQFVKKGELIGYMGNTGVEYMGVRAHLHLEIYFGKFIIGLNRYRRSFDESFKIYKMLFNYKD